MSPFPGLPGLYVAGVFSASLSTVSSVFNSLSAVILEDFVRKTEKWKNMTEEQGAKASKLIALTFGLLCLLLASLGDFLGSVVQASTYNINVFTGGLFGIFCLGLFFPWSTSKGTLIGVVLGLGLGLWMSAGSQISNYSPQRPPISTEGCQTNETFAMMNSTFLESLSSNVSYIESQNDDVLYLYKVSYLWLSPFVIFCVVSIGLIASFITGPNDINDVDPRFLAPPTRYLLKKIYGDKFKNEYTKSTEKVANGNCNGKEHLLNGNGCIKEKADLQITMHSFEN